MGASLGQQRLGLTYDLHSGIDLGPQDSISNVIQNFRTVIFAAASKPNGSLRVRQARMGGSNVWVLVAEETSASEAFSDAAFVVETGLLGEGYSLRCLQRPLDYVRIQQEHFILGQYDGTQRFRSDATFTFRRGELHPTDSGGDTEQWLCLMLTTRPGLYAHMEKDGQLTAKAYSYVEREAFHFKAIHCANSATTTLLWDVSEPTMGLKSESSMFGAAAAPRKEPQEAKEPKFLPRFSLPDYDLHDLSRELAGKPSNLPSNNDYRRALENNHFEAVD